MWRLKEHMSEDLQRALDCKMKEANKNYNTKIEKTKVRRSLESVVKWKKQIISMSEANEGRNLPCTTSVNDQQQKATYNTCKSMICIFFLLGVIMFIMNVVLG